MLLSEKGSEENNNIFLQCEATVELWNILQFEIVNAKIKKEFIEKEGMDNDLGLNLVDHIGREKC